MNITIDDSDTVGSNSHKPPLYQPENLWNVGNGCTQCAAQIDGDKTYKKTWHDTRINQKLPTANVTLTFNGTALYVFAIIPNNAGWSNMQTHTRLIYNLDGVVHDKYDHAPELKPDCDYNTTVYSNNNISIGQHTFVIGPYIWDPKSTVEKTSLFLFDYAIYTYDDGIDDEPSGTLDAPAGTFPAGSNKPTSVRAVVGGIAGGVVALILVALGVFLYVRHKRRVQRHYSVNAEALDEDGAFFKANPASGTTLIDSQNKEVVLSYEPQADDISHAARSVPHPSKAATRQAALLERRIDELTRAVGAGDASVLEEVNALRQEVERLRVQNTPPAYYGEPMTSSEEETGAVAAWSEMARDTVLPQDQVVPGEQRSSRKRRVVNDCRQ